MKWKIYYSDGSTISDEDATPYSIERREGIQVIVQPSPDHNWVTLSGYDFYCWDTRDGETQWWGCERSGLDWYLRQPGYRCVLFGTFIGKKRFGEIFDKARSELGDKPIFASGERKP